MSSICLSSIQWVESNHKQTRPPTKTCDYIVGASRPVISASCYCMNLRMVACSLLQAHDVSMTCLLLRPSFHGGLRDFCRGLHPSSMSRGNRPDLTYRECLELPIAQSDY